MSKFKWTKTGESKVPKKILTGLLVGAVALVLLIGVLTCFYTVDDKQQAVVTTFGKVTDITDAGLHFMLPFGIQKAHLVDVNVYQKIELGYSTDEDGGYKVNNNESTLITGFS